MLTEEQRKLVSENITVIDTLIKTCTWRASFEEKYDQAVDAVLSAAQNYDPAQGSFSSLASMIFKRRMIDRWRRVRRRPKSQPLGTYDITWKGHTSLETITIPEQSFEACRCLATGMTYVQTARYLGIPRGTLASQLNRMRRRAQREAS